jgi:ATP-dependent DNA helicase RecQ
VLIDRNHLKNFVKNLNNHFKQSLVLHLVRAFGGSIFRDNIEISLNNISNELGISEKEIDDMLLELNNSGVVDYIRPLEKESIRLLKPRIDSKRLEINYKRLNDSYINAQKKLDKIIEFVYSKDCRFKVILDYFGEDVTNHRCGKCDNCTNDVSQTDKTFEYLQEIILKTVYENKDGITNTNLINLLTGKSRSNILNKFSTFGICSNYSKNEIEHVIQNLISFGQLKRRLQGGKKIILANRGKDFLAEKSLIENEDKNIDYEKTLELFHILREVRTKAANKFNQPKYLVCSDELLRKIATLQPKTKFEMLSIKGFSERMYNKVGEEFLSKISEFSESESSGLFECEEKAKADITSERLPENILETYKLINQGFNLNEIAVLRNLSEAVISMQIESILFYKPELDISKLVDDATIASVKKYFDDGLKELKVIKEKLGNSVNYSQLRIILAKFKSSPTSS